MTLIHNYIYREVIMLAAAIIAVLTFLLVSVNIFRVIQLIMYSDLPIWVTIKYVVLALPLTLTITMPAGLLTAVLIVLGRMSSDRELLSMKAAGIGLAPIVSPIILLSLMLSVLNYWLVAYVVPESQKEYVNMKRVIVMNNPLALFTPDTVVDKIPGWRIYCAKRKGTQMDDVMLWRIDTQNKLRSSIRADHAILEFDPEHQQLVMTLLNSREETYPAGSDAVPVSDVMNVTPGSHGGQMVEALPLNTLLELVGRRIPFMTMPEIEQMIYSMQTSMNTEEPLPYLTELQARISFSIAAFTFVVVGIPLAIQTQRRETSWGIVFALLIVGLYYFLGALGRGFKNFMGAYPELIVWTPNILFQAVGFWLFYRVNRK